MADNQTNRSEIQDITENMPKKKELRKKSKENLYQRILELDRSAKCIEQYELFAFIYRSIIHKARKLDGYKDSAVYLEKYEKKLEELMTVTREEIYQKALENQKNATKAEDLQWIRKEIHRIPGYKDVDEIAQWCDSMQEKMERREKRNAWLRVWVLILVIGLIVAVVKYW